MLSVLLATLSLFLLHPVASKAQWGQNRFDYVSRNLKTIQSIYNLTVYPNNVPVLTQGGAGVPKGLFNADATGRVNPVGNFTDFEDSIEYFFALAPTPQSNTASTGFWEADVVEFTSGCPSVAASTVYLRSGTVDPKTGVHIPGKMDTTLKQIAFWRFDKDGQVLKYDAVIPNLALWVSLSSGIDYSSQLVEKGAILMSLCPGIQQSCTGKNQQYKSVEDCAAQLITKPFGSFDEVWADNIVCRIIHVILTRVRPEVHCPHVGPTGGGKCVNINYSDYYFDDLELFKTKSPFSCHWGDWADG